MIDIEPPREVAEWIGKDANQAIPTRVIARIYLRAKGCCQICKRKLGPSDSWQADHIVALVNDGSGNRERNLQVACSWCHAQKTCDDVAIKAKTARVRAKHIGIKRASSRPIAGSKASGWKHKMTGEWVRR